MRSVETYIIENDDDLTRALELLHAIFDAKPGTPEGDRAEMLAIVIEQYEERHHPICAPDPIEAIRFAMDQRGYSQSDLAEVLGSKSRASEVMSGKRKLTLSMIAKLHKQFRIPLESLVSDATEDAA
jgi:HTH-type transcriptional regulator / antitoxin HigA